LAVNCLPVHKPLISDDGQENCTGHLQQSTCTAIPGRWG